MYRLRHGFGGRAENFVLYTHAKRLLCTYHFSPVPAYAGVIARPYRVQSFDAIDFFDAHDTLPVLRARASLSHGAVRETGAKKQKAM